MNVYIKNLSDLHLEFHFLGSGAYDASWIDTLFRPDPRDPYTLLILAGDIEVGDKATVPLKDIISGSHPNVIQKFEDRFDTNLSLIENLARQYSHVVYVCGNHEYYHNVLNTLDDKIYNNLFGGIDRDDDAAEINITFLNKDECKSFLFFESEEQCDECEGPFIYVAISGGTLWTDFGGNNPVVKGLAQHMMNDYRQIGVDLLAKGTKAEHGNQFVAATPEDMLTRHFAVRQNIMRQLNEQKPICGQDPYHIVVTHHAPSYQSIDISRYGRNAEINKCYASDLDHIIHEHDRLIGWFHGHTHTSFDYFINRCRVVCNPRGYWGYGENIDFDPNILFKLEKEDGQQHYRISKVSD